MTKRERRGLARRRRRPAELEELERNRRVLDGLHHFRRGLEPYVTKRMNEAKEANVETKPPRRAGPGDPLGIVDPLGIINAMHHNWEKVFEKDFNNRERYRVRRFTRTALNLAYKSRNDWAHFHLDGRTALHGLEAMHDLLLAVNAASARIRTLKRLCTLQRLATRAGPRTALKATRITDPESDDLYDIWLLHKNEFPDDEIADGYDSFKRWVDEIDENDKLLPKDHELDDIMLALKCRDLVVGYLYAQHYVRHQHIFISYIVIDPTFGDAHNIGVAVLLKKLVQLCEARSEGWHAILGEVEQVKGKRERHDIGLFRKFEKHARQLAQASKNSSRLFMIKYDYEQPIIRPEDLGADRSHVKGIKQKLLYFARNTESLHKESGGQYRLQDKEAINVFDTLLSCVYGDAYAEDDEYQEYIRETLESHKRDLAKGLPLIDLALARAQPRDRGRVPV